MSLESATHKTTSKMLPLAAFALLATLAAVPAYAQDAPPQPTPAATPAQSVPHVSANAKVEPSRVPTYDNKYEFYGGLNFMNGQAGQNLPKRYNMGGAEGMFTYWLGDHLGVAADYRWGGGTTPIFPNPYYNRVLVMQSIYSGGVQWRGPRNRYVAIDYHALAGVSRGTFDHAIQNYPGGSPASATGIGLYPNGSTPWGAAGGSIDFNYKPNIAIRIAPDMTFEHFGTETREFVSVSLGAIYRFGKR
ncbi:MAG TPA: hypothetical protein VFC39_11700 [Acidobacteriaceae bacterium]|nr:hypothetical protein [Acidobacteriaceae bacterium]